MEATDQSRGGGGLPTDDGEPTLLNNAVSRSSSSHPLLESAPFSDCAAGEDAVVRAPVKGSMYATADGKEKDFLPPPQPAAADGCGGQQLKSSVWGYFFGRRCSNKQCGSPGKEEGGEDASSQEGGEEHDEEGKKGKTKKKKKRSSWLPDPDKRWPIQGFY